MNEVANAPIYVAVVQRTVLFFLEKLRSIADSSPDKGCIYVSLEFISGIYTTLAEIVKYHLHR